MPMSPADQSASYVECMNLLLNSGMEKENATKILQDVNLEDQKDVPEIIKFLLACTITNPLVYMMILSHYEDRDVLLPCLRILHSKGVNFLNGIFFLERLLTSLERTKEDNKAFFIYGFENLLTVLEFMNIPYQQDERTFRKYSRLIPYVRQWAYAFLIMNEIGYNFKQQFHIFDLLIKSGKYVTALSNAWYGLYKAGAKDSAIYKILEKRFKDIKFIDEILNLFKEHHITYSEHPELFTEELFLTHDEMLIYFFDELKNAGFHSAIHHDVFLYFAEKLSIPLVDYIHLTEVLKQLCHYAQNNALSADAVVVETEQQRAAIKAILDPENNPKERLAYSPLNLSRGTELVAEMCKVIVASGLDNIEMYYQDGSYFFHDKPGNITLNLSLIIRNANLSQLCLDDQLVEEMGPLLESICHRWLPDIYNELELVRLLKPAERAALEIYIDHGYANINRLFRDDELILGPAPETEEDIDYSVVWEDDEKHHITALFLLGSLLHHTINRTPHLQEPTGENLGKLHKGLMLLRKEKIDQDIIDKRTANSGTYPALTSFSLFRKGVSVTNDENVSTNLDNGLNYPMIYKDEREVIFPQGTQVITRQIWPDYLVATIVNTPTLERGFHYWSDLALQVAREMHLIHPYKDEPEHFVEQDGVLVNRPNHGLVHAFDVQNVIIPIVQYFAKHGDETEFKEFCQSLSSDVLEMLRIAAAFNVSGREGESSYHDDPERYLLYRMASADNFVNFVLKTPFAKENTALIVDMHDVIRARSNPDYEHELNVRVNDGTITPEKAQLRKYLHRILSFAHDINLVRCYYSDEYKESIANYLPFVEQSELQQADLNERIRYVIELHKAQGNELLCDMTPEGDFIDVGVSYSPAFFKASSSIKDLNGIAEGVTRPSVTLPFQWTREEPTLKRKSEGETSAAKRQMVHSSESEMPVNNLSSALSP